METLMESYRDTEDHDDDSSNNNTNNDNAVTDPIQVPTTTATITSISATANDGAELAATKTPDAGVEPVNGTKDDPSIASEDLSSDEISEDNENPQAKKPSEQDDNDSELNKDSPKLAKGLEDDNDNDEEEEEEEPPPKKQKQLSMLAEEPQGGKQEDKSLEELGTPQLSQPTATPAAANTGSKSSKKSKKKSNNVWTKPTSRKGKKKTKNNNHNAQAEDTVLIQPIPRFPDKNDDSLDMKICLSKVYKAEKVELSEDRLSAGSTKGYRMVRATRGVMEGAWYFEIKVVKLGDTGHTRLGWSTEKGDLQAPVGYDGNSFGYRDIDGSKVHKALRDKYGEEGYVEGDVIGFYINLPEGSKYAPKPPHLVWYKGQRYVCAQDPKEDPPKVVPESEISFFKNGVCQGVAFKDLYGGRYYPAASMYTLPNQPNCVVKFKFGPDFDFFPEDFGGRPVPNPMIEVPYHGFDGRIENGNPWSSTRMCPMLKVVKEQDTKPVDIEEICG